RRAARRSLSSGPGNRPLLDGRLERIPSEPAFHLGRSALLFDLRYSGTEWSDVLQRHPLRFVDHQAGCAEIPGFDVGASGAEDRADHSLDFSIFLKSLLRKPEPRGFRLGKTQLSRGYPPPPGPVES